MLYVVCIAKEIKNEQIKVFNCLQYVNMQYDLLSIQINSNRLKGKCVYSAQYLSYNCDQSCHNYS